VLSFSTDLKVKLVVRDYMTSNDRMINEYGAGGGIKLNWPEMKPANTRLKITPIYLRKLSCIVSSQTSSWALNID
jgi:hypothetical protein